MPRPKRRGISYLEVEEGLYLGPNPKPGEKGGGPCTGLSYGQTCSGGSFR
jgi:hypothetical protein